MSSEITVQDNFLDKELFEYIRNTMLSGFDGSGTFPWYMNNGTVVVSDENIIIRNEEVTEDSVILIQQSTILNSAGTYVAFKPHNVQNEQFVLIPYSINGLNPILNPPTNNGAAIYNVKIL